jgi:hypothetical protein
MGPALTVAIFFEFLHFSLFVKVEIQVAKPRSSTGRSAPKIASFYPRLGADANSHTDTKVGWTQLVLDILIEGPMPIVSMETGG